MATSSKETMSFDFEQYLPGDAFSYSSINDIEPSFLTSQPVQEDTMDVSSSFVPPSQLRNYPPTRRGPPSRDNFAGDLNFQVEIVSTEIKKKYLYSHKLGRIYVDMKQDFAVNFSWKYDNSPSPMFVRAMIVFTDKAQAEKRVERCVQHKHEDKDREIFLHILRSSRELKDTQGVFYDGDQKQSDSWYSVVVQYDPGNGGPFSHAYRFVCKNSCPNGINRRHISIIFTLEDLSGKVYGRELVGARVCACPRRDMRRDEDEHNTGRAGKRRAYNQPPDGDATADATGDVTATAAATTATTDDAPKARRIKLENVDDDVVVVPSVQVTDVRVALAGFEVMLKIMEINLDKCNNTRDRDLQVQCIESVRNQMAELQIKSASNGQ